MLKYLKENGFPITIQIETKKSELKKENWKGYESIVTDRLGVIIAKFYHTEIYHRTLWVNGFYNGFELTHQDIE